MIFVISPTKEMKEEQCHRTKSLPFFIDDAKLLVDKLQQLSVVDIMRDMKVNEKIAQQNKQRYEDMHFDTEGRCAIDTYFGLQFKQLQLDAYDASMLRYLNHHVRILSGLYGVLKPFDSIYPYRLEMQYKPFALYAFWEEKLRAYFKGKKIINVASKEYAKVLQGDILHIEFKLRKADALVTQSTQVKMARGKFMDYVVRNKVETLQQLKQFKEDGYAFEEANSSKHTYVFVKEALDESTD